MTINKKTVAYSSLIIVLAFLGTGAALTYKHYTATKKMTAVITDVGSKENSNPDTTTKQQATPTTLNTGKGQTTGTYAPPSNDNGITLSARQNDSSIIVTTQLTGYSDGTCTLTATNGSKTTVQTAQVIYQPQFSTCAGFSIAESSLGQGTWNLSLSVVSGGTTTSKATSLEVQ